MARHDLPAHTDPVPVRWIRLIALWSLVTAVLNLLFYTLVQFAWIRGALSLTDHIDVFLNSLLGFLTFIGLWRQAPWGWKIAVIAIPLSWVYGIYNLSLNYRTGMGVIVSTFLWIDFAIFIFLFQPPVVKRFQIASFWLTLEWIKYPLLVTAVFLMSLDLAGNRGAVAIAFLVFVVMMIWKRSRTADSNDSGNPD